MVPEMHDEIVRRNLTMIIKEDFNLNSLQYWISDGVITSQDQRLAAKVGNSSNMSAYNINCGS